jgi:hypothetical protein
MHAAELRAKGGQLWQLKDRQRKHELTVTLLQIPKTSASATWANQV